MLILRFVSDFSSLSGDKFKNLSNICTNKGKTYAPSKLGCVQCHGKDYLEIYNMWQEGVRLSLAETKLKLSKVRALLKSKPNKATVKEWDALRDAEYNYEYVKEAHGIHNPDYADQLLQDAVKKLDSILKSK